MRKHKYSSGALATLLIMAVLLLVSSGAAQAAVGNLSWGSQGEGVVNLQRELNERGYWCGPTDGIFGSQTYSAVLRFQKDRGLPATGLVGPLTRQALGWQDPSPSNQIPSRGSRYINLVATGYCPCDKCNYPYGGKPSYIGLPLGLGITAVDPRVIPMGSRLYVSGYGNAIAADQGNAIQGNRIDLCFPSHQEALNWGIRNVTVTVF